MVRHQIWSDGLKPNSVSSIAAKLLTRFLPNRLMQAPLRLELRPLHIARVGEEPRGGGHRSIEEQKPKELVLEILHTVQQLLHLR